MKKILPIILIISLPFLSCKVQETSGVEVHPQPDVHIMVYPHYHRRYYRYWQPGYWTWRNGRRVYISGGWYKIRHY